MARPSKLEAAQPGPAPQQEALAIRRTPEGWQVVRLRYAGGVLLEETPISRPRQHVLALEDFKGALAAWVLR